MDQPTVKSPPSLRNRLWCLMHTGKGCSGQTFNFFLVLLILISVSIVPVKFLPTYPLFANTLDIIEGVVIALFAVEYFLRIYAAPSRLRYIFSFYGIVDLLSIVPFYTGIFPSEYIRVLRLLRFLKIGEMRAGATGDGEEVMERVVGLAQGEKVEYVVSKHPLFLFINCIPPTLSISFSLSILLLVEGNLYGIAIAACLMVFACLFLFKSWMDFNYDVIYLTNYRLIFHNQHLFGRSINQMNYSAVTNVKPSYTNILSYIFRYGSLEIETAADTTGRVSIHMVWQHEKAAHLIIQKSVAAQHDQRLPDSDDKNSSGSTETPSL